MKGTIVCVGDVMVDVTAALHQPLAIGSDTPAVVTVGHGGSAANTAAWLARLGAPVRFLGRVGADAFGLEAATALSSYGVQVSLARDDEHPTGTCIVLVTADGERSMIPSAGANEYFSLAQLDDAIFEPGDHLHLSGYTLIRERTRPIAQTLLTLAAQAGVDVSVDASSAEPLRAVGVRDFLSWLPPACLLIANADEALVLSGSSDPCSAALTLLTAGVGRVVVKTGIGGAVVADGRGCRSVPTEAVQAIETTGAGDAFAAGLLSALRSGADLAQAAATGNEIARAAVGQWGARPSLGTTS